MSWSEATRRACGYAARERRVWRGGGLLSWAFVEGPARKTRFFLGRSRSEARFMAERWRRSRPGWVVDP